MKKLILRGDPGIRKDAVIEVDGEEYVCFGVSRQGDWHGPDRPMLWCTVGTEEERETYDRREYVPNHLETINTDAEAVSVVESS
jgi:hypothetical protein